jgi:hypothetical protein
MKQLEANYRQQQAAQAQKRAAHAVKPVEPVTPVVRAQTSPEGPKKAPELSEVERKWQADYQQQVQRVRLLNEQIRATNAWIEQAAQTLAQNPTLKTAQALKQACPDYGLRQVLEGQIKAGESYQFQVEWRAEQRQTLSRQAGSWFGLSSEAKEAKAKLAYLDDPKGSGLDYQMQEKHYSFWIHARQETKAKPSFGFQTSAYQKQEHALVSLSQFAQQRETAQQQEQAQQQRLNQYQNRGPRLGGRGMS